MDEYKWLSDALKPECDQVIKAETNYGLDFGIGCRWGEGEHRVRHAIQATEEGQPSLNAKIAAGLLTQADAINAVLSKRPANWSHVLVD